ncbi:UbiA family prenyltransferase [Azospirillum sp. B506]|uniref:UbiA family prenyltransferase n=1 Tax=Azospirillum sp. B506 TaxID=137721 RepID=UPI0003476C39|nr:UbiA family prenyltransferase [Azospirillum sp. B506]
MKKSRALLLLAAARPHHWLKNLLILLPGLAGHVSSPSAYGKALLAIAAFSLCASTGYVLNDIIDRADDRKHPIKRLRPFAAGDLPVVYGVGLPPLLLGAALILGWLVSLEFAAVLGGYFAASLAYSLAIKRLLALDVTLLACLYGMRVLGGGLVFAVPLSEWLVAFSVFLFLCLALMKRAADLAYRVQAGLGDPAGRPYRREDGPILASLSAAFGAAALVVLALYINSPAVVRLYSFPEALWGTGLILAYWLCRILILAHRGDLRDDPVAFAATDPASLVCGVLTIVIVLGWAL